MKKLLFVVFVLIQLISHAEYDSTYVLSVTQKYAIPENVYQNDYVGIWQKNLTWKSVGTISYAIQQNYNDAFAINSSTGLITIADSTQINGQVSQQDMGINLIIRTTDSGLPNEYEDDTAQVWIKENAYCRFFDFGGAGDSTRANPANFMPTGAKRLGYGYFMKRGVTFLNGGTVTFSSHIASEAHPTIVAAYGTGTKPRFRSTDASSTSIGFTLGTYITFPYDTDSSLRAENIRFYDIHMQNYYASAFRGNMPSSHFGFYNLDIMNCNRGGNSDAFKFYDRAYDDSTWYMPSEMISLRFDTTNISHSNVDANKAYIKWGAGPLSVTNCWFGPCVDQVVPYWALRLTNGIIGSTVKHCHFKPESPSDNSDAGCIQIRQKNVYLLDNIMEGSSNGIYAVVQTGMPDYATPHRLHAENNWFKNNTYRGMMFHQAAVSFNPFLDILIEDNLYTPTSSAIANIMIRDFDDGIIRRNKFIGGIDGILSSTSEASNDVSMYYNVFHGQSSNAIEFTSGTNITVYNNTVDGSIYLTGATSPLVRNNFYKSSTTNTSNNLDIDAIVTGDYFTDYAGHNYSLKSTATSAIDDGLDLNLTPDIQGTAVGDSPDIGAYEYVSGGGNPTVTISATDASATEQGETTGTFTVSRTGATTAALTINFSTPTGTATLNTDYTLSPSGSVTIPIGSLTATVTVTPDDDAAAEGNETVILTLATGAGYTVGSPSAATVTIADNDEQGPYGGTARSIPGTIQIEDYDTGGEGIAYHDNEAANNGGGYRTSEGVDIASAVEDGSYIIGWFKNAEWMEYTVNVDAGTYNISIRVANPNDSRQLKVYMDGSLLTTINVPNTGSYNTWQTATINNIEISGGNGKVLKLENVNNDFDFNWIQFTKVTPTVSISATDASAAEQNQDTGTFTVSRTGSTSGNLTVNYTKTGTTSSGDYTQTLTGSVTISDGNSTATVTITPVDDATDEGDETVALTLTSGTGYTVGSPSAATITIADNDSYQNPIAHWMFEQNGNDASGNGHTLTLYGSPVYATGADGYGINLNTTDRYANAGTINLGSEFTITGWYKCSGTSSKRTLVANSTDSPNGFCFYIDAPTGQFTLQTGNGSSYLTASSTTGHHVPSTWIHYAVVVNKTAGTCTFYVNGTEVTNSSSIRTDFATNSTILLGKTTNTAYKIWGYLDDVRLYDYQLTESDISDIYNLLKSAKVTTGAFDQIDLDITVFPVPCTDFLTINGSKGIRQIVLVNLLGQPVLEQNNTAGTSNIKVNTSTLKSGYYVLKLIDHSGKITSKSIVKK